MKEKCRHGFQRFCNGTSCHGFNEFYHSKSVFWSTSWLIILITAFGLSAYQMYPVVKRYIEHPTVTVITPANENEILYPPIRLCYMLWVFWIDYPKALSLGFNREQILYAFNYVNVIFTSVAFDIEKAENDFKNTMAKNNFKTLSHFFQAVAKDVPPIEAENNFSSYFDKIEIFFRYPAYMLCYKASESRMRKFFVEKQEKFDEKDGQQIITFQTMDAAYANVREFVTKLEYNRYMLHWIEAKSMYKIDYDLEMLDFGNFSPPVILYPNAYSMESVDIFAENDAYWIDLMSSSRKFLNNSLSKNICLEGQQSFDTNRTCRTYCRALRDRKCTCRSIDLTALLNEDNQLDNLCQKGVVLITTMSEADDRALSKGTYADQLCPLNVEEIKRSHELCKSNCLPACQLWTWDMTVSTSTMSSYVRTVGLKNWTNISIEYPAASNVMLTKEEPLTTWENMLGNLGGLLGVWTGASLISVVQLFYLCCFADTVVGPGLIFHRFHSEVLPMKVDTVVQ